MAERNTPALTKAEWTDEVAAAIARDGWPWKVQVALVEQTTPMCYAEVTDHTGRAVCRISLARDRFLTLGERRDEIRRQLRERVAAR